MDKIYWQEYYKKHEAPLEPSRFARYVMGTYVSPGRKLVELGCGNGRDATFFGSMGVEVTAIDQAESEVKELNLNNTLSNVVYRADDFTDIENLSDGVDVVYSRFTLHSVDRAGQSRALGWAANNLVEGGFLCIEARGQKNDLFGKGDPVEGQPDAFIFDNHYRRFLGREALDKDVMEIGLTIISSDENKGYAPFNGEDNFFIRHISQKPILHEIEIP